MGEEVGRVREGARGVRGAMKSLFPARVEVETLQQDLQHLQVTTVEPPSNGHIGDEHFVHCSEVVPSSEVEMYVL